MRRRLSMTMVLAAVALSGGANTAGADEADGYRYVPGVGQARDLARGLLEVKLGGGGVVTTHGVDHAEAVEAQAQTPGAPAERKPLCDSQYHQHVLYAYPSGSENRLSTVRAALTTYVAQMNALLNEAALRSGWRTADYKVLCTSAGTLLINSFAVAGGTDFSDIVTAARNAGFRSTSADYTIFYDGPGGCGIATYVRDDRLVAGNTSNTGGGYAVTYRDCWGHRIAMHENGHNQGAVQPAAPHSTGSGGHCMDEWDVMCYSDGGDRDEGAFVRCAAEAFDCGHDTYFDARPEAGEWLETHWNLGSPLNRFIAFDAHEPPPPARPSAYAGKDHTSAYPMKHHHNDATASDEDADLTSYEWTCRPASHTRCPEGAERSGALPSGQTSVAVPAPSFYLLPGYRIELTLTVRDAAGHVVTDTALEVGV